MQIDPQIKAAVLKELKPSGPPEAVLPWVVAVLEFLLNQKIEGN